MAKREAREKLREQELADENYAEGRRLAQMDVIDWPSTGLIDEVEFQGYCGACWAFSANTALSSTAAIRTGTLLKLSAQQQVDCTNEVRENKKRFGKFYDQAGCAGGYETKTWEFY